MLKWNAFEKLLAVAMQFIITFALGFLFTGEMLISMTLSSAIYLSLVALTRNGTDVFFTNFKSERRRILLYLLTLTISLSALVYSYVGLIWVILYITSVIGTSFLEYRKSKGAIGGYFLLPIIFYAIFLFAITESDIRLNVGFSGTQFLVYGFVYLIFSIFTSSLRNNWFSVISILFFWKEFVVLSMFLVVDEWAVGLAFTLIKVASAPMMVLAVFDAKSLGFASEKNGAALLNLQNIALKSSICMAIFGIILTAILFSRFDPNNEFYTYFKENKISFIIVYFSNVMSLGIGPVTYPLILSKPNVYGKILLFLTTIYLLLPLFVSLTLVTLLLLSSAQLLILKGFCRYLAPSYILPLNKR